MRVVAQTGTVAAERNVRVLKLHRETLRVLDAAEIMQKQVARQTFAYPCLRTDYCTRGCGSTKKWC